ncbi:uncharacterized protein E0L32_010889 [Thyridium curvatum]|uniref:Amidohydrolase 3 domain-containing protein n=1 Tax=Thyridium curvatum TaxID=1093900 RepID=A0A507AL82_9PEZI|nr:uncharacterized protein E0L32_010889 [Thyridium curvatum]TPX07186.1 hypothetical protein E0L32_010889 [Thyridium curvatum]
MDTQKAPAGPCAGIGQPTSSWGRRRASLRRSRGLRRVGLACLAFIAYAQWRQIHSSGHPQHPDLTAHGLSIERLRHDLATCTKLHTTPTDPTGSGRDRSARYVEGQRPTLIRNATVWTGEPAEGTSSEEAWAGKGYSWIASDVFLEGGLIKSVAEDIQLSSLPRDVLIYDARGRPLTAGIIDMHSHAGVHSLPTLRGNEDVSELSADITPYVRSLDGIQPMDRQLQVIKSGGVTTSLILPGSSNNIGGEAFVIKHAVGRADGRNETSLRDLLADPGRTWRYMKMGCGENAKHVHGKVGERGPLSRLGESWEFRHAFERASKLRREQDDWCQAASVDLNSVRSYLPYKIEWEALIGVLRGQVHVHVHCYTIPDLEAFVDHTNEFKFPVKAFHHAHQTYLVPEQILKRAWGRDPPASALFADNMWYKAESYIGSEFAGKHLHDHNLTTIYVSDNPVLNAQHVVFEAAKAYRYGLPYHAALASVTSAPAERLGLGQRLGKVISGFDADIVVWDSDPLSVGATPVQVWIDGAAQYESPVELNKPLGNIGTPKGGLSVIRDKSKSIDGVVIFTGISRNLLSESTDDSATKDEKLKVIVSKGKIICVGQCEAEVREMSRSRLTERVHLKDGYLTPPYTAFGSTLGLNAIESESDTDNGDDRDSFSRGIDGLALGTEKLRIASQYGVTRAISAPKFAGINTHHGTSVGFKSSADTALQPNAIFAPDAAVHYTLDLSVKGGRGTASSPSLSATVGTLRHKLLAAVAELAAGGETVITDQFSEKSFLRRVVQGNMTLCLTAHSADMISAVLRVKVDIDDAMSSIKKTENEAKLRLVIVGGAEAHLVARELASARVGVVLSPAFAFGSTWDQRRALTGAPLTNGTGIDILIDSGVMTVIGLEEDWVLRDLGLLAGVVHKNSGGRVGERAAMKLISQNIYQLLGLEMQGDETGFVLHEGSPFEIDSSIKAVAEGNGYVDLY